MQWFLGSVKRSFLHGASVPLWAHVLIVQDTRIRIASFVTLQSPHKANGWTEIFEAGREER